jgi:hypothetical protein
MNNRLERVVLAALGPVVLGGCAGEPAGPTILDASEHPYVTDLPLPAGFKLVERLSEDRVMAGHRVVNHIYHGKGSLQAVKNFYQQSMPQADWEPVGQSLNKGVYLLSYRKGQELSEIRIERMPSGLFGTLTQIRGTIRSSNPQTPATTRG